MKKIISLALAAIMTLTASARPKSTEQFQSVVVDAPIHLVILRAPGYSINLMSRNNALKSALSYKVKDGKLYLCAKDVDKLDNSRRPLTVIVTAPEDVDYKLTSNVQDISKDSKSQK